MGATFRGRQQLCTTDSPAGVPLRVEMGEKNQAIGDRKRVKGEIERGTLRRRKKKVDPDERTGGLWYRFGARKVQKRGRLGAIIPSFLREKFHSMSKQKGGRGEQGMMEERDTTQIGHNSKLRHFSIGPLGEDRRSWGPKQRYSGLQSGRGFSSSNCFPRQSNKKGARRRRSGLPETPAGKGPSS